MQQHFIFSFKKMMRLAQLKSMSEMRFSLGKASANDF